MSKTVEKSNNKKVPPAEIAVFCHETAIVLKSGISLVEGMNILVEEGTYRFLKEAVSIIALNAAEGNSFSDGIVKSGVFPDYFTNMVKMGEASGNLDLVMEYMAGYYEKVEKYNSKIRAAVTYPLILSGLMACVILLLIVKVMPMFNEILESIGGEVPAAARIITSAGKHIAGALPYIAIAIAAVFVFFAVYFKSEAGGQKLDEWKLKLPVIKKIYTRIMAARIGLGMSIMLRSGLGNEQAISLISGITGNRFAARIIEKAKHELAEGKDIPQAFTATGIFPTLFLKMLSLGSKTGSMEDMLKKASDIYENEVDNMLQKLTSAIEPVLVVILSAVIGVILLTVMIPLISIMSSIG